MFSFSFHINFLDRGVITKHYVQQSVGSNPGRDTCVPEQDTLL